MGGPSLRAPYTLKEVVANLMQARIYPVNAGDLQSQVSFTEINQGG